MPLEMAAHPLLNSRSRASTASVLSITAALVWWGTSLGASPLPSGQAAVPRVTIGADALLNLRGTGALPEYPASSLAKGTSGVAVATINVGVDGITSAVEVHQAPDAAIAAAIRRSFAGSTWRPLTYQGQRAAMRAKIVLYFKIEGRRGTVVAATAATAPTHVGAPLSTITEAQWKQLKARTRGAILVDIGSRTAFDKAHLADARNIPEDELAIRARGELPKDVDVVLDCPARRTSDCARAAGELAALGYTRLSLLIRN